MNTSSRYIDEATRLLDPSRRDLEPAKGDRACAEAEVRAVDRDKRTVTGVVSTRNVDRFEEIIEPTAFEPWLDNFMRNPVFLAGHNHVGFDAAEPTVIGSWQELRVTEEGLLGTAKFADTPLAERYWSLFRDGHMRAFSVGGLVHEWEMREFELEEGVKKKLRVITEMELIEISAVAVPANRESLVVGASGRQGQRSGAPGGTAKGVRLGERIRQEREAQEKSLEEVAAELPITASALGEIERGEIIRPPDEVLDAIAEALDLSFEELQRLAEQDAEAEGAQEDGLFPFDLSGQDGGASTHQLQRRDRQAFRRELSAEPGTELNARIRELIWGEMQELGLVALARELRRMRGREPSGGDFAELSLDTLDGDGGDGGDGGEDEQLLEDLRESLAPSGRDPSG